MYIKARLPGCNKKCEFLWACMLDLRSLALVRNTTDLKNHNLQNLPTYKMRKIYFEKRKTNEERLGSHT